MPRPGKLRLYKLDPKLVRRRRECRGRAGLQRREQRRHVRAGATTLECEGPFDPLSPAGDGGGYLNGGIGWYRKTFATPPEAKDRRVWIEFDGVYMDSDVWLNGKHLGRHPYGFTSFYYDLTDALKPQGQNVLAVRVNVAQPCSRWYSGAGIFRHVRLQVLDPVHVAHWGTYVTTPTVTRRCGRREDRHPRGESRPRGGRGATLDRDHRARRQGPSRQRRAAQAGHRGRR